MTVPASSLPERSKRWPLLLALALCISIPTLSFVELTIPGFSLIIVMVFGLGGWVAMRRPDLLWTTLFVAVPLSLPWAIPGTEANLSAPLELLMVPFASVITARLLTSASRRRRIPWRHPMTLAVGILLLSFLASAITSPVSPVAWKAFAAATLYSVTFYGGALYLLPDRATAKRVAVAGGATMALIVLGTLAVHLLSGFELETAIESASPLYPNRLEYSMATALWLITGLGILAGNWSALSPTLRRFAVGSVGIWTLGILAAQARSTWLALMIAAAVGLGWRLWNPRPAVVVLGMSLAGLLAAGAIVEVLGDNQHQPAWARAARSRVADDHSLWERWNRWSAAARMWRTRPWTGSGAGSYEDLYGSYQHEKEMTPLSTRRGDRGDAHSEPMTALAERGLFGGVALGLLLATALATGASAIRLAPTASTRGIALGATCGLVAWAVSSVFNSYLELDKVAPLVWSLIGVVVVLDPSGGSTES